MKKETLKTTTSSRTYKFLYRRILYRTDGICDRCRPHSGCNGGHSRTPFKNWKKHRKTQYKNYGKE